MTASSLVWLRSEDVEALRCLREQVMRGIGDVFAEGDYGKSYEGRLHIEAPGWFDEPRWRLHLDLYAFGPARHYMWEGETIEACANQAMSDVTAWLRERREDPES